MTDKKKGHLTSEILMTIPLAIGILMIEPGNFCIHANNFILICCQTILPDGRIVYGLIDGKIRIMNAQTKKIDLTLTGHTQPIKSVTFHNGFIMSKSYDGTIKKWDLTGKCIDTMDMEMLKMLRSLNNCSTI
jgi:WD40 repeat protein